MMRVLALVLTFACAVMPWGLQASATDAASGDGTIIDISREPLVYDPATHDDFIYLSSRYADFGDFQKAFEYARRAYDLKGDTAEYNRVMSKIYFLKGSYDASFSHADNMMRVERLALPDFYAKELGFEYYRKAKEQWRRFTLETYPSVIRFCVALNQMRRAKRLIDDYEGMLHMQRNKVVESSGRNPVLDKKEVMQGFAILKLLKAMKEQADTLAARKEVIAQIRDVYQHEAGDKLLSNEKAAQEWVGFLGIIIEEFADRTGRYPSSLAELYEKEAAAHRPMTEMSGLDSSRSPKYHEYGISYSLSENGRYALSATPLIPGKTGTRCFSTTANGSVSIDDGCNGTINSVTPLRR